MSLFCPPASPEAKRLVEDISTSLPSQRKEKEQESLMKCQSLILRWSDYLPLRKDSLVTIDGVFKGEYFLLLLVFFPSVLINFRLTLIEFNY